MHEFARNTWVIAKREFKAYFATPLATVFLTIFVALTGAFAGRNSEQIRVSRIDRAISASA